MFFACGVSDCGVVEVFGVVGELGEVVVGLVAGFSHGSFGSAFG